MAERAAKHVIVNADDFGWTAGITEGIIRAHRDGIVTSATLAANMPDAAGAVSRLKEVPELGVGLHLNVTQGPPLSGRGQELAGPDGVMNRTAVGLIIACILRPRLIDAVEAEFEAQIRWALDRGLRPTHLDSHRHSHAFPPIFLRVIALARRYDIRFIRRQRECLTGPGWPASPAKQRRNRLVLNCLGSVNSAAAGGRFMPARACWGVAHTGLISQAWLIRAARSIRPGLTEIMTHPGLPEGLDESATRLRQSRLEELAALCSPAIKQEFSRNGIELVNYGRL
ncbi:MAG: ChbG/HpnK family deacetylase [Planctomycetes bacterium]|nr:ChbG/HpnK family deacetylase [Planctomycetota bacterium]